MKKLTKLFVLLLTVSMLATACSKNEEKHYPKISKFELGSGHGSKKNDAKAIPGKEIHIAAKLFAENKIDKVVVTIHPKEEEHNHDANHEEHNGESEIEVVYTDFAGQINGTFHKHIYISPKIKPGVYHFHFKVIDQKGLTTEVERDLTILEKKHYLKISKFELGSGHNDNKKNDAKAIPGRDIHIAAELFAKNKIDKVVVNIHPKGEEHNHNANHEGHDGEWEIEEVYTDFAGQINGTFHKHINIPRKTKPGTYHFHFKVVDKKGLTAEVERDLTVLDTKHKH